MHERGIDPGCKQALGLSQSTVDVWRVDLRQAGETPLHTLSGAERARAARIGNPARRALWMRGRGMLRVLLGEYLGRAGDELELVTGRYGKPALGDAHAGVAAPAREPPVHFNLSHSGPLALYAFTAGTPVGVDVELVRELARKRTRDGKRTRDEVALAERIFGEDAARRLRQLQAPAREREFLALWVRHEAALKCRGVGLSRSREAAETDGAKLWIADLELGVEAAAAVALRGGPRKLQMRVWPAQAE